jgi:pantetheine-phosphate adenylyltransferase
MPGRVAIYAGSFDPLTLGHTDVIRRGAALFDELVVAVGNNPKKQYWFDLQQREALVRKSVVGLANVRVMQFSGLLVDAAKQSDAGVILRGLRALSDFDLEFRYGLANRDMTGIETLFLLSDPAHIFVSSSLIKEIAQNGGDVRRYVPAVVLDAIRTRLDS